MIQGVIFRTQDEPRIKEKKNNVEEDQKWEEIREGVV